MTEGRKLIQPFALGREYFAALEEEHVALGQKEMLEREIAEAQGNVRRLLLLPGLLEFSCKGS
jgi:hypothetical protein